MESNRRAGTVINWHSRDHSLRVRIGERSRPVVGQGKSGVRGAGRPVVSEGISITGQGIVTASIQNFIVGTESITLGSQNIKAFYRRPSNMKLGSQNIKVFYRRGQNMKLGSQNIVVFYRNP